MNLSRFRLALVIATLVPLGACAGTSYVSYNNGTEVPESDLSRTVAYEVTPEFHRSPPDCVVVRPFGEEGKTTGVGHPVERALTRQGGIAVLRGNLAPHGCVVKPSAATETLFTHRGPALVFDNYPDLKARLNDPDLDVTKDTVLVLRSAGPEGAPGFPEWGMLPIPDKLLKQGVRDMVRLSDARMSGTSYGMCVLHLSPESHVGGPLTWPFPSGVQMLLGMRISSLNGSSGLIHSFSFTRRPSAAVSSGYQMPRGMPFGK